MRTTRLWAGVLPFRPQCSARHAMLATASSALTAGLFALTACGSAANGGDDIGQATDDQALSAGESTLFGASSKPNVASDADPNAVEVGVRFKADVDGQVTGVRFYKGAGNTGNHDAHFWTSGGDLLATQRFTSETRSGWQTVRFSTPIAIKAGESYVVSYHTDRGHYAGDNNYFAGHGVDNGPLHAPADTASEHNGVYHYGASAFPTDSYEASNYWVDVVFKAGSTGTPAPGPTTTTSPPPSPSPSPSPPSLSGWPDETNTGVPKGITLKPSGGITVDTPGTVLDGYAFTGTVTINANNVTLKNCTIVTDNYWAVRVMDGTGTVVQDCTIDCLNSGNQGISGAGTFLRNNIMRCSDGINVAGDNTLIQDNYIHAMGGTPESHEDSIQADGGFSNLIIRHNTLVNELSETSAIMLDDYWGPIKNAVIDNNRLIGGGYPVYVSGAKGYGTTGVRVTNNRMKQGYYGYFALYSGNVDLLIRGNVDDATGVSVDP